MSTKELIDEQLDVFPEELQQEVLDYVMYLRAKKLGYQFESILMSASVLQDWFTAEEDEAWKDL
jgi:hypothetical protein